MTEQEILKSVAYSDANKVKIGITDIDGVIRGKTLTKEKFKKSLSDELGFCNVIFGWDMNDRLYENTGVNSGYPDAMASVDLETYRKIPWNGDIPFFLADFRRAADLSARCPRTLLARIRDRARERGFTPLFSAEYEWFNFRESPASLAEKKFTDPQPLTPGMFGYSQLRSSQNSDYFDALFDLLHQFDIPVEGIHTETGDGVYEASIEYSEILGAADRATLFKTGVKEIAYRYELVASFMAKWNSDLPGCGGHIHQSLWENNGERNLFYEEGAGDRMSETLRHYIAGQLHCLPAIVPLYAPTVNSYKRFVPGSWAATDLSWGIENRTTALRVINHNPDGMRLETRVPGSDANPYLAMAAALASGLYGIEHKLPLETDPTDGNAYRQSNQTHLPRTLADAIRAMKESPIAKELFGDEFVDHFIKTREWEWSQYSGAVTDWERKRYFEII